MQDEALYKCRLLLFEDPVAEAQTRHKVAVRVGRNPPVAHDTFGHSAHFSGVHRFEDPMGTTAIIPNCGGMAPMRCVMYCMALFCCTMQSLCNGGL